MDSNLKMFEFALVFSLFIPSIMLSGCTSSDPREPEFLLSMSLQKVKPRDAEGVKVWDVFIHIDGTNPSDFEVEWIDIYVVVVDGHTFETILPFVNPVMYDYQPSGPTKVCYQEITGIPGNLDMGDVLVITSVSGEFESSEVRVRYNGAVTGHMRLPAVFPEA